MLNWAKLQICDYFANYTDPVCHGTTSSAGSGVPIENQHVKGWGLLYGGIKCYKNSDHAVKS